MIGQYDFEQLKQKILDDIGASVERLLKTKEGIKKANNMNELMLEMMRSPIVQESIDNFKEMK